MIKRSIALRYAKALFDLDQTKENLEKRLKHFATLQKLLEKQPKLLHFLQSPQIRLADKERVLKACFKNEFDALFFHFFFYLIEKRRLNDLSQIAIEYHAMVDEFLDVWEAKITTAVPLDSETEQKLRRKLEGFYHKKVNIKKEVNPKIIGGAILVVANEMIDWSVAGRLKRMKENLLAANV